MTFIPDRLEMDFVMLTADDLAFARRILTHFVNWGPTPMDRELARQACQRLAARALSPDGEPLSEQNAEAGQRSGAPSGPKDKEIIP